MAAPICNFEFFIEISQGLLRTAPGLVRTCEIFENWGNPKSLAVLRILELSCQEFGILELSWQGLKSTGVSVRASALWFLLGVKVRQLFNYLYHSLMILLIDEISIIVTKFVYFFPMVSLYRLSSVSLKVRQLKKLIPFQ